jgi:hypothetical protein
MLLNDGIGFQDGEDSFLEVTVGSEVRCRWKEKDRREIEIPG